ncbi:MAG TPA: hypothetical protein VFW78_12245 [Bacteroidia bacterium]|nr:hypothetical protein [Bacteroidia bacterium]
MKGLMSTPKVFAYFHVDIKGKVNDVGIIDVSCMFCPDSIQKQMQVQTIEVLKNQPNWKVARGTNGRPVAVKYNIPVSFKQYNKYVNDSKVIIEHRNDPSAETIFEKTLWLKKHILYEIEKRNLDSIFSSFEDFSIRFNVSKNGVVDSINISNCSSIKASDSIADIIKQLPGWVAYLVPFDSLSVGIDLSIQYTKSNHQSIAKQKDSYSSYFNKSFYESGVDYYNANYYFKALLCFLRAVEYNPEDIDALYNCMACYIKLKNYPLACQYGSIIKALGKPDADKVLSKYCQQ